MLLIGGRNQVASQSGPTLSAEPVESPASSWEPAVPPVPPVTPVTSRDPVQAEVDRTIAGYHQSLREEHVIGGAPGVEVHMRLDGEVFRVDVAEHVPVRYGMDGMSDLIVAAMRAASVAAARQRDALMEQVTFFGEPAARRVQKLIDDPDGSLDELSAVRYW